RPRPVGACDAAPSPPRIGTTAGGGGHRALRPLHQTRGPEHAGRRAEESVRQPSHGREASPPPARRAGSTRAQGVRARGGALGARGARTLAGRARASLVGRAVGRALSPAGHVCLLRATARLGPSPRPPSLLGA